MLMPLRRYIYTNKQKKLTITPASLCSASTQFSKRDRDKRATGTESIHIKIIKKKCSFFFSFPPMSLTRITHRRRALGDSPHMCCASSGPQAVPAGPEHDTPHGVPQHTGAHMRQSSCDVMQHNAQHHVTASGTREEMSLLWR